MCDTWSPIETADKNENAPTVFIWNGICQLAWYSEVYDAWCHDNGTTHIYPSPTHWMPLPPDPED